MYQIDQSIRIENTNKPTYVAIANGTHLVCVLKAKDKKTLKLVFRKLGKPLIFRLFSFAYLCAIVIEKTKPHHVTIDLEYKNHNVDIKNYIFQILSINHKVKPEIYFKSIGKKSRAHLHAYKAYQNNHAQITISFQEIIKKYGQVNQ